MIQHDCITLISTLGKKGLDRIQKTGKLEEIPHQGEAIGPELDKGCLEKAEDWWSRSRAE